jgi:hypothetical protein
MKVRRSECGVMPLGQRVAPGRRQVLVRPLDRFGDDAAAGVVAVLPRAALGREHEVVGIAESRLGLVDRQLLAQRRKQIDLADPGVRLRVRDPQPPGGQIDIAPAQIKRLADPQPRERQSCQQRPARRRPPVHPRLGVKLAAGVEQRDDLLRTVEPRPLRPALLQPPPLPSRRVAVDQLALDSDLEDLSEPRDRLVDRRRRDRPLAHLLLPVSVDLGNRDLRQPVLGKERQHVVAELPGVVLKRGLRKSLVPQAVEPLGRELVEGRLRRRLLRLLRLVRRPDAAPHVGQDVRQLVLGLATTPPFGNAAERQVAPLAVGAEAQRERLTALAIQFKHLPCRLVAHPRLDPILGGRVVLPVDRQQPNLRIPTPLRLIRPLTRAGGRVSRRTPANPPQHPRRDLRVEAKPWLRPLAELDRAQLDCVRVDPGALDPEAAGKLRGIDQLALPQVKSRVVV